MAEFLTNILAFPALPLTVAMGVVLLYWLFVIIGAVGIEALDHGGESVAGGVKAAGEAMGGALKAAGEAVGGLKGAGEVAAHAAAGLKGAAEAAAHAGEHAASGVKGATHAATHSVDSGGLMSLLGLGNVPVTITFSSIVFFAWLTTLLAVKPLDGTGFLPRLAVLFASLVASLLVSSVVLRPVAKVFNTAAPASREDIVGKLCTITSGRVDAGFGTAQIEDGSAGLNVHVVCNKTNSLKKGDRALLVSYDEKADAYDLEPLDWLEPAEQEALKDPARAAGVIASRIKVR